jgi:hypothetical protein
MKCQHTLDQLLVLVQLLQIIGGHGIGSKMLSAIDILSPSVFVSYSDARILHTMLITEDADAHVGARDGRQANGSGETLVTLRVIVLEADLKLDCLL